MPYVEVGQDRIYYEFTGPEDGPLILQFGGSLFGRANFGSVNDGFRKNFRLLSFDATGYGQSDRPIIEHSVERWANEGAGLLDALGIEKAFVHGTSMGGMVIIAFAALHSDRMIAGCADCAFARADNHRRTLFRNWRNMSDAMPIFELADLVTIQAVGADFLDEHPETFDLVRSLVARNDPYTVRQACFAMEKMDLEPLVPKISKPLLMTNGTHDIMTPPDLAPSGYSARQMAAALPGIVTLYEFPTIGHADLLEAPEEATRVITDFFQRYV
ncbi:MAG: alpha/beta fold hydrolase [Acidimicrobiales bacterium]